MQTAPVPFAGWGGIAIAPRDGRTLGLGAIVCVNGRPAEAVVNGAEQDARRSVCLSLRCLGCSFLSETTSVAALKPPVSVPGQHELWVLGASLRLASSQAVWGARRVPVLGKAPSCPAQDTGPGPGLARQGAWGRQAACPSHANHPPPRRAHPASAAEGGRTIAAPLAFEKSRLFAGTLCF